MIVREHINFERGLEPKDAMETGDYITRRLQALYRKGKEIADTYFYGKMYDSSIFSYNKELAKYIVMFFGGKRIYFLRYHLANQFNTDHYTIGFGVLRQTDKGDDYLETNREWILNKDLNDPSIKNRFDIWRGEHKK